MSDQSQDISNSPANLPTPERTDEHEKPTFTTSGEPDTPIKTNYYLLMVYAALFGPAPRC